MTASKPGMTAQDIHSVYYMDVSASKGVPRQGGDGKAGVSPAKDSKPPRPAAAKKSKPK